MDYNQSCNEILSLSDGFVDKIDAKFLRETITINGLWGKVYSAMILERLAIIPNKYTAFTRLINERFVISDLFKNTIIKIFEEAVSIVEDFGKFNVNKLFRETLTVIDLADKSLVRLFTEVIILSEAVVKPIPNYNFLETIKITDAISFQFLARVFLESITATGTFLERKTRTLLIETLNISSQFVRNGGALLLETLTIVESKIISLVHLFLETITVVAEKLTNRAFLFEEIIELKESTFNTLNQQVFAEFNEVIIVSGLSTLVQNVYLNLLESITLVDKVLFGKYYLLNETVTIDSLFGTLKGIVFGEQVIISETFVKTLGFRIIEEVITITDSLERTRLIMLSEIITLVDTILNVPTKLLLEVITLNEIYFRQLQKMFVEVLVITDSITKQFTRLISEAIAIVEETVTFLIYKLLLEKITLIQHISNKYNGIVMGLWSRVAKDISSTWRRIDKDWK